MTPIRCNKNKKDKNVLVTPPSRPPRNQKYLNAGLLRGKTPSEVALIIREPREPCVDSFVSSSSSSFVVSTTPSDEELEVAEHEELEVGEYDAYDDEEMVIKIEEEGDQGNDEDEDENGGGSSDEEDDEDDGNGEVIESEKSRMYAEYCQHIENPQAKKMFADLEKQCKRTRRTDIQLTQERAQKGYGDVQGSGEEGSSQRGSPGQGPSKKSRTSSSQGSQRGRGGGRGRGGCRE
ncbi:chromatin modification-related protein EAF7-like [Papaver somniferum]|uniref:chromatin modification-related protein EAF7-like n=1 Tax=Papaver somniferum TaxID=3469 RepID=UPI000E6FA4B4|nr:chromatin modification-related protein EAF7-like [Papaver somniferum]